MATISELKLKKHALQAKELEEYKKALRAKREEEFKVFLELAEKIARHPGETVREIAIALAVEASYCPPEWSGYIDCASCGLMPAYEECKGEKVVACPWCHTKGSKALKAIKEAFEKEKKTISELVRGAA